MGLPPKAELYSPWDRAKIEKPFCLIGDPTKLRILVPVAADDYELIRADLAKHKSLEVTLRVHGFGSRLWSGKLSHLPKSADKTVPLQLTTRGGGPLALKPGSDTSNADP